MAEVEIGGGGVEAGLDAHGLAGGDGLLDALLEGVEGDDLGGALRDEVELVFERWECRHGLSLQYKEAMPDRVRKREKETPKKEKICRTCGRAFAWSEARARDWDVTKYCSQACSGYAKGERDAELEAAILELLGERGAGKTICPSDAAKRVGGVAARRDWEGLMQPAREAARRLVRAGKIVVMQNGRVVDAERAKGALRFGLQ